MSLLHPDGYGRIHSTESFGAVDGPGIRFVVFMQGCLFRCLYCHNPDTLHLKRGSMMRVDEILEKMNHNAPFYSSGGLTVSGGEPLLQASFTADLLETAQSQGWHTCLDTNGYHNKRLEKDMLRAIKASSLVMLDIKHMDPVGHEELTGQPIHHSLEMAERLQGLNLTTRIRYVVVPGYNDDLKIVQKLCDFIAPMDNVKEVEILPLHHMGKEKWKAEGMVYKLENVPIPTKESILAIRDLFSQAGKETIFAH